MKWYTQVKSPLNVSCVIKSSTRKSHLRNTCCITPLRLEVIASKTRNRTVTHEQWRSWMGNNWSIMQQMDACETTGWSCNKWTIWQQLVNRATTGWSGNNWCSHLPQYHSFNFDCLNKYVAQFTCIYIKIMSLLC